MHECDFEPEHPLPWLAVDQLRAMVRELRDRGSHVVDLVRDVVHARAALGEELPDGRIGAERGEQLDPAFADTNRCGLDALVVHTRTVLEAAAEEALVRTHCLVEVGDGNAHVMNSSCFHPGDATAAGSHEVASGTVGVFG